MSVASKKKMKIDIERLNRDIRLFPQVHPITPDMKITHKGVSRLVMLDRYSFKDTEKVTLTNGDFVVLTIKEDPKFPARGLGYVLNIDWESKTAQVLVEDDVIVIHQPGQLVAGFHHPLGNGLRGIFPPGDDPLGCGIHHVPEGLHRQLGDHLGASQVVEQDGPVTGVGLRQSSGNLLEVRTNTPVGHSASGQHPNVRGHLGGHLADAFGEPGAVGNDYQANSHERDLADSAT
ncbi:MAG: hypothetical protein LOD92_02280, partial [Bacillales bacterium]